MRNSKTNIGDLDRFITWEASTDVNTKGRHSKTWATAFTCYAEKIDEQQSADQEGRRVVISRSTWRIPYNSAAKKDDRFYEVSGEYYVVTGVIEEARNKYHLIEAELRA